MKDINSNITECMNFLKHDETAYNYLLQNDAFIRIQINDDIRIIDREKGKDIIDMFISYFKNKINLNKEQLKYELDKKL